MLDLVQHLTLALAFISKTLKQVQGDKRVLTQPS